MIDSGIKDEYLEDLIAFHAEFGDLVRTRRHEMGMSQSVLSKMTGINVPKLSRIENNDVACPLTLRTVFRICHVLGISIKFD